MDFLFSNTASNTDYLAILPLGLFSFGFSQLATAFVVVFTPSSPCLRLLNVSFVVVCTWISVAIKKQYMRPGSWAALASGFWMAFLFQYFSSELISR